MAATFSPPAKLPSNNGSAPLPFGDPNRPDLAQYPPPNPEGEAPLQYGAPGNAELAQYPPPNSSFYANKKPPPPPPQPSGFNGHAPGYQTYQQQYPPNYQFPPTAPHQEQPAAPPPPPPPSEAPPAAQAAPQKRVETEEERRKRKEHERRKYEERKRAEAKRAAQQKQGVPQKKGGESGKEQNRLKRPTNFLCRIKFRNELPEVFGEPKFLLTDLDPDRYTKYTITTLEKRYKHKLLLEPDLGIPLDLMDLSVYDAPPPNERPPMDPEDRALLQDDTKAKTAATDVIRKKDRPAEEGMKWLVRTSYISNIDSTETAKNMQMGLNEKQQKQRRDEMLALLEQNDGRTDREKQIRSIEETFEAARQVPVHEDKPHLQPELVLPLLPDSERYDDPFVMAIFDAEPTLESERHRHYAVDVREEMGSRAMLKGYTVQLEGKPPERVVGYTVPSLEEIGAEADEREADYEWVREYSWHHRPDDSGRNTFALNFEDDKVSYLPLKNRIELKKRKAKDSRHGDRSDDEDEEVLRQPSRVTVQKRSLEDIEEDIRRAKVARIEEEERVEAEREEKDRQAEAKLTSRDDSDEENDDSPKRREESGDEEEKDNDED